MSFWDTEEAANSLTLLLEKENVELSEVLMDQLTLQELRTNSQALIDYLSNEKNIFQLCEWSMAISRSKDKDYDKCSRAATEILTCQSLFLTKLLRSNSLRTFIKMYLANKHPWDLRCAGHFQRVVLHLLSNTSGGYLSSLPDLISKLLDHVNIVAISDLIIKIVNTYPDKCDGVPTMIIHKLVAPQADLWYLLYILRRIYTSAQQDSDIRCEIEKLDNLDLIISAVPRANTVLLAIEFRRLLHIITCKSPKASILIANYQGLAETATASFATLSNSLTNEQMLNLVLTDSPHWSLIHPLVSSLRALSAPEFTDTLNKCEVVDRFKYLIENEEIKSNHLEIAKLIDIKAKDSFDRERWNNEVMKSLYPRLKVYAVQYGGEVPIGTVNADHKLIVETSGEFQANFA